MTAKRRTKKGTTAIEYAEKKLEQAQASGDQKSIEAAAQILMLVKACR